MGLSSWALSSWALPCILNKFRDSRTGTSLGYLSPLLSYDLQAHAVSKLWTSVASQMLDQGQNLKPARLEVVCKARDNRNVIGYSDLGDAEPGKDREISGRCTIGAAYPPTPNPQLDSKQSMKDFHRHGTNRGVELVAPRSLRADSIAVDGRWKRAAHSGLDLTYEV
jgi:hypothetical protein